MNNIKTKKPDYYNIVAYLFFLFLIVWAVITKEERILMSDPAFYFFNIVNQVDFFYPGVRYTAIINQFPLVIATRMHLSLDSLLTVYSVSFVVVRLFYFFLANNVFKNRAAGYAIIAISFVGVAESYFRPTSESTIALLNSILLYAWLCYADNKSNWGRLKSPISLFVTILLIVFGYVTHPIALFSLFFVLVFFALEKYKLNTLYPYLAVFFLFAIFTFKVFIGKNGVDHNSLYGNLIQSPFSILAELKTYYPYRFFMHHFKWIYYPYAILLGFALFASFKKHKWYVPAFLAAATFVYFVIACTSFKEGDSNMQMEKIFLPMIMFAALVFAASIQQFSYKNKMGLVTIAVVVVAMSMVINLKKYKPKYTKRISDIRHEVVALANNLENRKLVIKSEQIKQMPLGYCWAYGIETLVISTIDKNTEPLTVFIFDDPESISDKMKQPDNFMPARFQTSFRQSNFNKTYFNLPEQEYIVWDEDFKSYH